MEITPEIRENLEALAHLRGIKPEGEAALLEQVQAVRSLVGEAEAFEALRRIRWPKGIVCPRCGSTHIKRRTEEEALGDTTTLEEETDSDFKRFYQCMDCVTRLGHSSFSDLTGLPSGIHPLVEWIVCWYVLSFCSPMQAANLLGVGLEFLLQVAMSQDIESLPLSERREALEQIAYTTREKKTRRQTEEKNQELLEERRKEKDFCITPRPTRWK